MYLNTPPKIEIFDSEKKRKFVVQKEGLPEAGKSTVHLFQAILYSYICSVLDFLS